MSEKKKYPFEIMVPVQLEQDNPTNDEVVASCLELYEKYGLKSFILAAPAPSWRGKHYPPIEHYEMQAERFAQIKARLAPKGIKCGWWVGITMKGGPSEEFIRMTRFDGSETPFASCPLDPNFKRAFAERIGRFCKIARPDYIFTEDDYSIHAAAFKYGCFCKYHLAEFARREGKSYTREELVARFTKGEPDDVELLRRFRDLMRDSLVDLAKAARAEIDRYAPEVPMGYDQAGSCELDGDCTEAVCRAMAGENHTPYSRIHGAFYNGIDPKLIPERLFNSLYTRQHIKGDFKFIHESDTFPHTVFFTTGPEMKTLMGSVYSYGYEGSIHQVQQLLDAPNEETTFAKTCRAEYKRYAKVCSLSAECEVRGLEISYDPFYHTLPTETTHMTADKFPVWLQPVSRLSMPHTSLRSDIVMIDAVCARYYTDEKLKDIFSRFVFVEGDAAAILTERGYADLMGTRVTKKNVAEGPLTFDLGARDVIRESFRTPGKGKNMPSTHMFSNGWCGTLYEMSSISDKAEIISDLYTFENEYVAPTMTLYKNDLGGRVLVMGMTLSKNNSQSLYNYRRQRLWQNIIERYCDKFAFVKEAAHVYVIMNEAKNEQASAFFGMLTLTMLAHDTVDSPSIHLPKSWRDFKTLRAVSRSGALTKVSYTRTDDGLTLTSPLKPLEPVYLVFSR